MSAAKKNFRKPEMYNITVYYSGFYCHVSNVAHGHLYNFRSNVDLKYKTKYILYIFGF